MTTRKICIDTAETMFCGWPYKLQPQIKAKKLKNDLYSVGFKACKWSNFFPIKKKEKCICFLLYMLEKRYNTIVTKASSKACWAIRSHKLRFPWFEKQSSTFVNTIILMSFEVKIHHWGFCPKEVSEILTCSSDIKIEVFKVSHTVHFHLLVTIRTAWSQQDL